MFASIKNLPKIIVIVSTLWVLFFGLFQLTTSMDMTRPMINCPFSSHSMSICKMNPLEHIQEWQSMFTTLPKKNFLSFLFTILASVILSRIKFWKKFSMPEPPLLSYGFQSSFENSLKILHPLKLAYSRGILNPKTF